MFWYDVLVEHSAFIIGSTWLVTWILFFVLGRHGTSHLATDRRLKSYSSIVIFSFALFYTAAFSGVGSILFDHPWFPLTGISLFFAGIALMVGARWQLRALTVAEMLFAKSHRSIENGLYRYLRHPMYVGMCLVTLGSLLLYPNAIAIVCSCFILFSIAKKARIETSR